MNGFKWK